MQVTAHATPAPAGAGRQWLHLAALTFAHATADVFTGILAPVLPPLREHFGLSLTAGVVVVTTMGLSSNIFQLVFGNLRARWSHAGFIAGGVILAGVVVFVPFIPAGKYALPLLLPLVITAGAGVAAVHPEGLRGVHLLQRIPAALATSIFMVGGFAGFACGAWFSAMLVQHGGLRGLLWLYGASLLAMTLILGLRVRLATGDDHAPLTPAAAAAQVQPRLPFKHLLFLAMLVATAATIFATLLPTFLFEAGFALSRGGLVVLLFGVGGAVGSVFWGAQAARLGPVRTLVLTLAGGTPLMAIYLGIAARRPHGSLLVLMAAFLLYAAYPLIVTLARFADSELRLEQRMALIVGGAWGSACVIVWALGAVSERIGLGWTLQSVWVLYLAATLYAVWLLRRFGSPGTVRPTRPVVDCSAARPGP
jgi:FSR family fosmidomycin resistance protein-like MFS transporter